MKSKTLEALIKLFPRFKKKTIKPSDDLVKNGILDSMDLVTLVSFLQKKYKFNFDAYQKKNKKYTINSLDKFLK
jgi:acyl carrier protein